MKEEIQFRFMASIPEEKESEFSSKFFIEPKFGSNNSKDGHLIEDSEDK